MVFKWLRKPSLQETAKEIILDEMLREEVRSFVWTSPPRKMIPRPRVHYTRFRRFAATKNGTTVVGEALVFD